MEDSVVPRKHGDRGLFGISTNDDFLGNCWVVIIFLFNKVTELGWLKL